MYGPYFKQGRENIRMGRLNYYAKLKGIK